MGTSNGKPFFRADHVGSLLRPERLHKSRADFEAGTIDRNALQAVEDEAIIEAVKFQEDVGLEVITDGEFRRKVWWFDFVNSLNGIDLVEPDTKAAFSGGDEKVTYIPLVVKAVDKITRPGDIMLRDFEVLKAATSKTPKITIPSPSRLHFHGGRAAVDKDVYPKMDEFWSDVITIYREEIAALEAAGCRCIQIDDPVLTYFMDDRMRDNLRAIGEDPDETLNTYVQVINACISERRSDTYIGIHLCRGNSRSKWVASGPYDQLAEAVFPHLDVDAYYLEYDDERSGGFEPLRHMADGKIIVLGLITTKTGKMENMEDLKERVKEASEFIPMDMLTISPQCGFASEVSGNLISTENQRNKLALTVQAAGEIWDDA